MVKFILIIIIVALAGFIFFLTKKISRLKKLTSSTPSQVAKTKATTAKKETDSLKKEHDESFQKCEHLMQYSSEKQDLFKLEKQRLTNLNQMQIEKDKTVHEFELKRYEFTQSIELYNLMCSLIESSPYLVDLLKRHQREESVIILKNAANLTQEQYNSHRTMLFQVVDTVKQQLQPASPVVYKEAN